MGRRSISRSSVAGIGLALAVALPAHADPCKAIPDRGPLPAYLSRGATFSGSVAYVGDGDSLCVDVAGSGPTGWVEVRLADFYAPELAEAGGAEAKAALVRIAMGRVVYCLADHRTYDRIAARCTLQGVSLGDRMRAAGVGQGGRGR